MCIKLFCKYRSPGLAIISLIYLRSSPRKKMYTVHTETQVNFHHLHAKESPQVNRESGRLVTAAEQENSKHSCTQTVGFKSQDFGLKTGKTLENAGSQPHIRYHVPLCTQAQTGSVLPQSGSQKNRQTPTRETNISTVFELCEKEKWQQNGTGCLTKNEN